MTNLKPCPFCGKPWGPSGTKNAICSACKLEVYHGGDFEKLNARAPDPAVERLVAALEKCAEKFAEYTESHRRDYVDLLASKKITQPEVGFSVIKSKKEKLDRNEAMLEMCRALLAEIEKEKQG